MSNQNDVPVSLRSLHVYPVKSCAGVSPGEALLSETGFDLDRAWMVTGPDFEFVTQRELPRMALIQPTLKGEEMILRAPGMLALHIALDRVELPCRARIWKDVVNAFDMGALCAQWLSDFLGRALRLVRLDPDARRIADPQWTGPIEARIALPDGFPLLVVSSASLDELNRRLAVAQAPAATLPRFRPNLVLDGLDAHGEDHLDELALDGTDGVVRLKLVKPCARCPIPDVDPATGERGHAVGEALAAYRADARLGGAISFGMNAVIVEGIGRRLAAGQPGRASYRFD
ncbi:MAG: MOSC N-terminal beta barrel domain-containing protein [Pseudomonadota bacterium]|nr:MOSC N-terminal beta barrel domain-containing protein [Pseudomonadota bacterium]